MPSYSYTCNACNIDFELFSYIKDYNPRPRCISCNSKNTERNYIEDAATINCSVKKSDNELKTLGDLANRNRDRLSDNQKADLEYKHNKYKDDRFKSNTNLPKGMKKLKRQPKTKWT
jgi:putative FmdB family regulatory protein